MDILRDWRKDALCLSIAWLYYPATERFDNMWFDQWYELSYFDYTFSSDCLCFQVSRRQLD